VTSSDGQVAAAKFVSTSVAKKVKRQLRDEIRIGRKLRDDPGVVKFLHYVDTGKYHVLVFEKCEQGDLFDRIKKMKKLRQVMSEAEAAHYMRQVAETLHRLHTKYHIVHRDVKLQNIALTCSPGGGTVKLIDFGLGKCIFARFSPL
jgi:serine/threonine protein kinase